VSGSHGRLGFIVTRFRIETPPAKLLALHPRGLKATEPDSAKAIQVRDEFRRGVHELLSPDIFPIEVAHNLAKCERRGLISLGEGTKKLADVFSYMPDLHPYLPLTPQGVRHRLGGPYRSL
jgi:hypothetical protein